MRIASPFALAGMFCLLVMSCNSSKTKDDGASKEKAEEPAKTLVEEVASGFCNCFSSMESKMSGETKSILIRAAGAEKPGNALQEEIMKLDAEKQQAIASEMSGMSDMENPSSEIGKCMEDLKKKYEKSFDVEKDNEKAKELLDALSRLKGCDIGAALMKIGFKMKDSE